MSEKRWFSNGESVGNLPQHVKTIYGELNSWLGNMPLAVLHDRYTHHDGYFFAYAVHGDVAYFVQTSGLSQQEFVELLISVYEAPSLVTQGLVSRLREEAVVMGNAA